MALEGFVPRVAIWGTLREKIEGKVQLGGPLCRIRTQRKQSGSRIDPIETMSNTIESARAIAVRYLPPTNCRGARIKLLDTRGIIERPVTLSRDYEYGVLGHAIAFLREQGWNLDGARTVSVDPEQKGDTLIVLRDWTARDHWKSEETR